MKLAKQRPLSPRMPVKPRNPLATDPLLKKGGAHQRRDKHASRARQKDAVRRQADET
jgi:hypothetical protein